MMFLREFSRILAALLVFGLGVILLYHFVLIAQHGGVVIYESRSWMLGLEIALAVLVLGFGLFLLFRRN